MCMYCKYCILQERVSGKIGLYAVCSSLNKDIIIIVIIIIIYFFKIYETSNLVESDNLYHIMIINTLTDRDKRISLRD